MAVKSGATFIFDVEEIDDIIDEVDETLLAGQLLRWHNDRDYPLVVINGSLFAKMRLNCRKHPRRWTDVYLQGGMHSGAWCYAHDKQGHYLANLRDQEFACDGCA